MKQNTSAFICIPLEDDKWWWWGGVINQAASQMLFLFGHCTDEKRMQQCLLTLILVRRPESWSQCGNQRCIYILMLDFDVRCKEVGVRGNSAVAFDLTRHSSGLSCSSVSGRAQLQSTKRSSPEVHIPPLELDDLLQHLRIKQKHVPEASQGIIALYIRAAGAAGHS